MSTARPLDIKVIYSASSRRPRKPGRAAVSTPRSRATSWALLGAMSLIVAGVLTYATWWPVDKFIYLTFTWKTPVLGVDANAAAGALFPNLAAAANSEANPPIDEEPVEAHRYVGETATIIIGATAYSWLTLSTVAVGLLALFSGAAFGRAGGTQARRVGVILAAGGVLLLAWQAFDIFSQYDRGFPPSLLRAWMAGLIAVAALIGLAIGRGVRGLGRTAGVAVIIAAVGTAVALHLGKQCGAVSAEYSSLLFLLFAFLIHSLYGWILLFFSFRLGR